MKVILTKDVPGIGRMYDVKNVAEGYASNFLFPRGLAKVATDAEIKRVEATKAAHEAEMKVQENLLAKSLESLKDKTITIAAKANEKGHLFSGITAEKIAKALQAETRMNVAASLIELKTPIKEVGEHTVDVSLGGKITKIKVEIQGE